MQAPARCQLPQAPSCGLQTRLASAQRLQSVHSRFNCGAKALQPPQRSRRSAHRCRAAQRLNVQAVIPALSGDANEQTPPDLPSFLFKERIIYLGMSLAPAVTELMLAELLYLQYDNPTKPINMYINSPGVIRGGDKLGYEHEAFSIYDTMLYVKNPIRTLCIGTAFGESAMLLAAGTQGMRASLPSASIMLRQPMQRFAQMQASDIDIYRNEIRKIKSEIVNLLSKHTNQEKEVIEKTISRPKYFEPQEAKDFGIIDKVLSPDDAEMRRSLRQ